MPRHAIEEAELASPTPSSGLVSQVLKVRRRAVPGIVALALTGSIVGIGVGTAQSAETDEIGTVPASTTRTLDTSRDMERPEIIAPQAPAETPPAEPQPTAEPVLVEPQPVSKINFDAAPETKKPSPSAAPRSEAPTREAAKETRMFATENVNVRAEANTSSDRIARVAKGGEVTVTGAEKNDFLPVTVDGKKGWAASEFLSKDRPAAEPTRSASAPSASTPSASAPSAGRTADQAVRSSSSCPPLRGLSSAATNVHQDLCSRFPSITSYGGVRNDPGSNHNSGRAIDAMISGQPGWDVANYARANASSLGITEVIYAQKIWTTQRAGDGWRSMSDRGSATANHYDHVHISTK